MIVWIFLTTIHMQTSVPSGAQSGPMVPDLRAFTSEEICILHARKFASNNPMLYTPKCVRVEVEAR